MDSVWARIFSGTHSFPSPSPRCSSFSSAGSDSDEDYCVKCFSSHSFHPSLHRLSHFFAIFYNQPPPLRPPSTSTTTDGDEPNCFSPLAAVHGRNKRLHRVFFLPNQYPYSMVSSALLHHSLFKRVSFSSAVRPRSGCQSNTSPYE